MSTVSIGTDCFGMYGGDGHTVCVNCQARQRCKALLVSDIFPIMGELIDTLMAEFPAIAQFRDTMSIPEIVDQLINPPTQALTKNENELLSLMAAQVVKSTNQLSVDDI